MAEENGEPGQQRGLPPPRNSGLSGTERMFVRLTLWQTVLSVVGVVIATIALYAALTESAAVRQQTAAAVWPFVQLSIADHFSPESARFKVAFTNAGVGPAKIYAVKLVLDKQPVTDWEQAVQRMGGKPRDIMSRNFISGRVLRPDETVDLFSTQAPDLVRGFQAAMVDPDTHITFCYCSIFDDCWLADSRLDLQNPAPVEQCPDFGAAALNN